MMRRNISLALFIALALVCLTTGCEEKRKALVAAHTAMGELLITTKEQAKILRAQRVISPEAYESIRANWLQAQISYVKASDMLEYILSSRSQDITAYADLITQVSLILNDITLWMEENKNEPGAHHIPGNPTPAPDHEVGGGDTTDSGHGRIGQGDAEESSKGDEGQGGVRDVGGITRPPYGTINQGMEDLVGREPPHGMAVSLSQAGRDIVKQNFVMSYEAIYNARQEIFIHGIEDNAVEVRISVLVGSVVYTLDGSTPVLTDGVPYLSIHQSIVLDVDEARRFRAVSSMDGTKLQVLIFNRS